jgi:hypothetical protein
MSIASSSNVGGGLLRAACILALLMPFSQAHALCSESKVLRLAEEGETVADIAEECEMSRRDVRKVLDRRVDTSGSSGEPDTVRPPSQGLPPGTPLAPCGCWGPADPGMRQPAPNCASGYARPQMCNAMCQMGGFAWQGVCS